MSQNSERSIPAVPRRFSRLSNLSNLSRVSRLTALLMGVALTLSACSNQAPPTLGESIDDQTSVLGSGQGNTYYVSVGGNNNNDGLSTGAPWRNLTTAISRAQPGDTVLVMNGTYTGDMNSGQAHFVINKNGTAANWIRFKAMPGHSPKLLATNTSAVELFHASYVEVSGFEIAGQGFNAGHSYGYGVVANTGHHLLVSNNEIYGFPVGGVGSQAISHFVITDNVIHENAYWNDNQGSGISIWRPANNGFGNDSNGYSDYIVGNTIYANENKVFGSGIGFPTSMTDGNGIILDQNNLTGYNGRTLIANNVVFNNGGKGIHVFMSSHADVYNNTTYHNSWTPGLTGHRAEIDTYDATDVRIANNIAWPKSGIDGVVLGSSSNVSSYNNIVVGANNVGSSDISVSSNPGLVNPTTNPANANFSLTSSSNAIDAGLDLVNNSFGGGSRPSGSASDIGAFEYSGGSAAATASTTTTAAPAAPTTTTTTTTAAPKASTTTSTTAAPKSPTPSSSTTTTTVKPKAKPAATTTSQPAAKTTTTTVTPSTTTTTTTTSTTTVVPAITLPEGWSPFVTTTTTSTVPTSGGFSLEGILDELGKTDDSADTGAGEGETSNRAESGAEDSLGEQPDELAFEDRINEARPTTADSDSPAESDTSDLDTSARPIETPGEGPTPLIPVMVGITFLAVIGAAVASSRRRPLKLRR